MWKEGESVAHLLLICTFRILVFASAAGVEVVNDIAPFRDTLKEKTSSQKEALVKPKVVVEFAVAASLRGFEIDGWN